MNMPKIAIVIGVLLSLVGLAGVAQALSADKNPVTAMIPLFFGVIFAGLGGASIAKPTLRKHLMHALAALALLGALASGGRLASTWNKDGVSPVARATQGAMAVLCVATVALCVKSFRDARRVRELTASA